MPGELKPYTHCPERANYTKHVVESFATGDILRSRRTWGMILLVILGGNWGFPGWLKTARK